MQNNCTAIFSATLGCRFFIRQCNFVGMQTEPPIQDHVSLRRAFHTMPPTGGQVKQLSRIYHHFQRSSLRGKREGTLQLLGVGLGLRKGYHSRPREVVARIEIPRIRWRIQPEALGSADAEAQILMGVEVYSGSVAAASIVGEDALRNQVAEAASEESLRIRGSSCNVLHQFWQLLAQRHLAKVEGQCPISVAAALAALLLLVLVLLPLLFVLLEAVQEGLQRKLELGIGDENRPTLLVMMCQALDHHTSVSTSAPHVVTVRKIPHWWEIIHIEQPA
mmetsp:Transcript_3876/g.8843  ORF Transcript_3876/g.8843 Transcript_3876/m.8843 type:complete len:277 (-) Transcript_3876:852-1682(-)